ncbi:MAG: glycosyltransferase [Nitrospirota bacterium]|nr:glycosyltransferase [Nitrospirota bacterium]
MNSIISRQEVRDSIGRIGSADIVVGIPSYNNARTIGHVVRAIQAGLAKYFPDRKCVLVNSDGGSRDGTMDVVRSTRIEDQAAILVHHRTDSVPVIATAYEGIPGKGSAFRTIFQIADALDAKACAVVDSDLRSITPEWVELLIKPVIRDEAEFVAPLYHRHKFDGTITNSIVYPLTRALYGKSVRQPIGGDFGFSGKLARFYLSKDVWETDVARFGVDIWMTTTAVANGFNVSQSFLGAKIHDTKDPGADLSAMLYQVVSATFGLMEDYAAVWKQVKSTEPVRTYGFQYAVGLEQVNVNVERMLGIFREGLRNLREIWIAVVGQGDFGEIELLGRAGNDVFRFPRNLWSRIIYDYALAFHHKKLPAEHLIKSLTPLYLGRTASFVLEMRDADQAGAEAEIERLCEEFEKNKVHLQNNWK